MIRFDQTYRSFPRQHPQNRNKTNNKCHSPSQVITSPSHVPNARFLSLVSSHHHHPQQAQLLLTHHQIPPPHQLSPPPRSSLQTTTHIHYTTSTARPAPSSSMDSRPRRTRCTRDGIEHQHQLSTTPLVPPSLSPRSVQRENIRHASSSSERPAPPPASHTAPTRAPPARAAAGCGC